MMQNKRRTQTAERIRCVAVIDWLLPIVVIWRKTIRHDVVEMANLVWNLQTGCTILIQ